MDCKSEQCYVSQVFVVNFFHQDLCTNINVHVVFQILKHCFGYITFGSTVKYVRKKSSRKCRKDLHAQKIN